ncbi:MAG: putative Ig domain-containing protein [Bacteroidota bacterium]
MLKICCLLLVLSCQLVATGQILLEDWRFKTGDDSSWADPSFDDSAWDRIKANVLYENQGYDYNGYSWYRVRFYLPESLREASYLQDSLRIFLGRVDDIDETYLNGQTIGGIGTFPAPDGSGAVGFYDKIRRYVLPWNHEAIRWDEENVIAVRVYDGGGGGGLWGGIPSVGMVDLIDFVDMNIEISGFEELNAEIYNKKVQLTNSGSESIEGTLTLEVKDRYGTLVDQNVVELSIRPAEVLIQNLTFQPIDNARVSYLFEEKQTGKQISDFQYTPYILTPPEAAVPLITNPAVYGARPGNEFLWRVCATGARPMVFGADNLPNGLDINPETGIISGRVTTAGEYQVTIHASSIYGRANEVVTFKIGDTIALTPPMGWNSWNAWGMLVSDEKVRESVDGLVTSGLINHGWTYINVDDGWQGERRENGVIGTNDKFPDMWALGEYVHDLGLKFGIYSSPGEISCGGLPGSLGHDMQDVQTWASWGVDYIKYDWCSYSAYLLEQYGRDQATWTIADQVLPFRNVANAIDSTDRDIILSVANWGMNDAWEWAHQTGGQLWRTTGDIEDNWKSVSSIGFSQEEPNKYSSPGGWGDPDMLVVGWLGWGDNQHQSRLTPTEQYTHISLWALLSAPMMIGCDLSKIDAFTYNLLANHRVNAINQDPLGQSASVVYHQDDIMVWAKPLHDGSQAIGIFNLADEDRQLDISWADMELESVSGGYNAWTHEPFRAGDGFSGHVYGHGVQLLVLR